MFALSVVGLNFIVVTSVVCARRFSSSALVYSGKLYYPALCVCVYT